VRLIAREVLIHLIFVAPLFTRLCESERVIDRVVRIIYQLHRIYYKIHNHGIICEPLNFKVTLLQNNDSNDIAAIVPQIDLPDIGGDVKPLNDHSLWSIWTFQ
jgi:hypothetical protein